MTRLAILATALLLALALYRLNRALGIGEARRVVEGWVEPYDGEAIGV